MPHPQEKQPTTHDTQQGVGEGTSDLRRRFPRSRVNDVSIAEASGLTLGVDGSVHPLETDAFGNLKVTHQSTDGLLEELILLQKATVFALSLQIGWDWQDLIEIVR